MDARALRDWTQSDVTTFLRSLKLSADYSKTVRANGIDGKVLQFVGDRLEGFAVVTQLELKLKIAEHSADALKIAAALEQMVNGAVQPRLEGDQKQGRKDGFQKVRVLDGDIVHNPVFEALQDDSALDQANQDLRETRAQQTGKRPSMAPRWSVAGGLDGERGAEPRTPKTALSIVYRAAVSWTDHMKLISLVLIFAIYLETCRWLYSGGYSSFFQFVVLLPAGFLIPTVIMGSILMAISNQDTEKFVSWRFLKFYWCCWVSWVLIPGFLMTNAGNMKSPLIKSRGVQQFGQMWFIVGHVAVFPGYLLYRFRAAFRWHQSKPVFIICCVLAISRDIWQIFNNLTIVFFDENRAAKRTREDAWDRYVYFRWTVFLCLAFYTSIVDSMISFQRRITLRGIGGYLCYLIGLIAFFPFWAASCMAMLMNWMGRSGTGLLAVLFCWSILLTAFYLNARLVAQRCIPISKVPVMLLPLQICGDMFTEMVFMDLDISSPSFWAIVTFDVALLIARDADLYDDLAVYVKKHSGRIGQLVLFVGELFAGTEISTHLDVSKATGIRKQDDAEVVSDAWDKEPTANEYALYRREITENCVVSEIMSTMVLLVLISTNIALHAMGAKGESSFAIGEHLSNAQRVNALYVYVIILCCQVVGIFISHAIIAHKNALLSKVKDIQNVTEMLMPAGKGAQMKHTLKDGMKWHFFLSHAQATAGDQVCSLALELKSKGYSVWYDQMVEDLTCEGMKHGVAESDIFILFLSAGVMARPFVQLEIREAIVQQKKMILIHEQDPRFNPIDFEEERLNAPADLKDLFSQHESIAWRRRHFERMAVLQEVMKRAGDEYVDHLLHRIKEESESGEGRERRLSVSVISPHSLWFNRLYWFRLCMALSTTFASLQAVKWVACIAAGKLNDASAGCAG